MGRASVGLHSNVMYEYIRNQILTPSYHLFLPALPHPAPSRPLRLPLRLRAQSPTHRRRDLENLKDVLRARQTLKIANAQRARTKYIIQKRHPDGLLGVDSQFIDDTTDFQRRAQV